VVNDHEFARIRDLERVGLGSRDYFGFLLGELPKHALSTLARREDEFADSPFKLGNVAQHFNKEPGPIAANGKVPVDDNVSQHRIPAGWLHLHLAAVFGSLDGYTSTTATNKKKIQHQYKT